MRKKDIFPAFTLTEIIVSITIISIMALWISKLDFSRLSQKQQIDIEVIKIVSIFEEIRNNSFLWRWVGWAMPSSWEINFSQAANWSINTTYNGSTSYPQWDWASPALFSILNITCWNLDWSSNGILTAGWILTFNNGTIDISGIGCNNTSYRKLIIEYGLWTLKRTITINTLSGIIEVD